MTEKVLEQLHYLDVLFEAATYNERVAFNNLQAAKTEFDRMYEAQEIETWKGVLALLKQRDQLIKNIKLLIKDGEHPDTIRAVQENLKDLGVEI